MAAFGLEEWAVATVTTQTPTTCPLTPLFTSQVRKIHMTNIKASNANWFSMFPEEFITDYGYITYCNIGSNSLTIACQMCGVFYSDNI